MASAASAKSAVRRSRVKGGVKATTVAARPSARPTAKVTRPEATSHHRATAVHSAAGIGWDTPERLSSVAASAAEAVPASTPVVRTPSQPIRYGDRTLYEAVWIPPYQERL
ncbi:hypothetical protein GCM10009665_28860 [Kitasatospora nipponensis]|uniref:Uncharacterized protein n=1 Tax=Kitasatospora nipponensis TaxID=258049 RepID=A0ABN1W9X6_9ACTN